MALSLRIPLPHAGPLNFLGSNFVSPSPLRTPTADSCINGNNNNNTLSFKKRRVSVPSSSMKYVRNPALDRHIERQQKIRFVQKLKTLLLSKPKHFMPLHILSKCRAYLSLPKPRSILSMIYRYPTIFETFPIPTAPLPANAVKPYFQLCVRLTPAAAALAAKESELKSALSVSLATKLQKLLMLSPHRRLLLSKLVHLAPDLGLPRNFRSRLCIAHPHKFKTVDTSYGRALELVHWDSNLAIPLPEPGVESLGLIVDRPLKFKHLRLPKGLNLKRCHREFLIKFGELPVVCPYGTAPEEVSNDSVEGEKRACGVVREVLAMMVEKRTLTDHLTHFRKDFGLPNRLYAMLVRHPEMFYVSRKGHRNSVFLVEAFDDKGQLLEKDESLVLKDQLLKLVGESKMIRRERRKGFDGRNYNAEGYDVPDDGNRQLGDIADEDDDFIDGFEDLYECEDVVLNDDDEGSGGGEEGFREEGVFWTTEDASNLDSQSGRLLNPW